MGPVLALLGPAQPLLWAELTSERKLAAVLLGFGVEGFPGFQPISSQFVETAFKVFNGSHQFQEQKRKIGYSVCSCLNTG